MSEYPKVRFPQEGMNQSDLLELLTQMKSKDVKWRQGRVFSYIYFASDDILETVKHAYNIYFSENALNPTAFASLRNMENEVVSMTADLFHGDSETCGSMTSGGTESLLMAIKSAREWAKKNKPHVREPEIILPASAHPALHKACHYFSVKAVVVEVGDDYRATPSLIEKAITSQTIMLVASAPSYPQGVMDDITGIAQLAKQNNLLCHVDSCIGGMMLPFLAKLNYDIPPFDFAVDGVTSISADIHKYGYAAKGASVVLYKNADLRKHQYYVYPNWAGGIYASPTMTGTRPGGAIAAAWAALKYIGMEGYLEKAQIAMNATKKIQEGINAFSELKVMGNPAMTIFSVGSDKLDVYEVGDEMGLMDWSIDRQQLPPTLHFTINPIHYTIVEELLTDLATAVEKAKKISTHKISNSIQVNVAKGASRLLPKKLVGKIQQVAAKNSKIGEGRSAAMYGMMGALQEKGDLEEMVKTFLDKLMRV